MELHCAQALFVSWAVRVLNDWKRDGDDGYSLLIVTLVVQCGSKIRVRFQRVGVRVAESALKARECVAVHGLSQGVLSPLIEGHSEVGFALEGFVVRGAKDAMALAVDVFVQVFGLGEAAAKEEINGHVTFGRDDGEVVWVVNPHGIG